MRKLNNDGFVYFSYSLYRLHNRKSVRTQNLPRRLFIKQDEREGVGGGRGRREAFALKGTPI